MSGRLEGKSILLVEDDDLVSMSVEDILSFEQAGSVVPVRSVSEALAALDAGTFDVAMVDVNLNGEPSWPVAAALRRLQVPYLTVSGYGDLCDHELVGTLLPKPYSMDGLVHALNSVMKKPGAPLDIGTGPDA